MKSNVRCLADPNAAQIQRRNMTTAFASDACPTACEVQKKAVSKQQHVKDRICLRETVQVGALKVPVAAKEKQNAL